MRAFTFRDAKVRAHAGTSRGVDRHREAGERRLGREPSDALVADALRGGPRGRPHRARWANRQRPTSSWRSSRGLDPRCTARMAWCCRPAPRRSRRSWMVGRGEEARRVCGDGGEGAAVDPLGGGRATTTALRCAMEVPEATREPALGHLIRARQNGGRQRRGADTRRRQVRSVRVDRRRARRREARAGGKQVATDGRPT